MKKIKGDRDGYHQHCFGYLGLFCFPLLSCVSSRNENTKRENLFKTRNMKQSFIELIIKIVTIITANIHWLF